MRIAVTGIAGSFGTVITPALLGDEEVEEVVGIDQREPRLEHPKLRFEREDVRSPRMRELFGGCDVVIHLAFVVFEIRDKELTHSVNLEGSRNVIDAALKAGVKRLVIASSTASYGVHPDHPVPITEEEFPRGNPDKYYFYDKAEVEHYVEWWERRHPDAGIAITRIRPNAIVGPNFWNPVADMLCAPAATVPAEIPSIQMMWEDDLARAFHLAAKSEACGPFNVCPGDVMRPDDLAGIHGQRLRRIPLKVAGVLAEVLYRLRLSPVSSHWAIAGEGIASAERARRELGWTPEFTCAEAARMLLVQRGRPMLPGRSEGVFARKHVAEKTLKPVTDYLRGWSETVAGLRAALAGPGEIDRMAERVEHVLIPYKDRQIHLEVHAGEGSAEVPTVVFSPGIGAHARFYLPALGKLCDEGFNVIGVDRPGHGLSEGRRGDCTIDEALDVLEEVVRYGRGRFGGPVALVGSSLGGIISWYALTRELDVEAAVCHNVAHPRVFHEPSMRWKVPALKHLATVAPKTGVPIKQIADFEVVSRSPEILDYMRREVDGIWCSKVTARSAASFFTYEPPLDWSHVETPALVLVGERDEMVSAAFTEEVLGAGRPPGAELEVLPGHGHLLFHDHLDTCLPLVRDWLRGALEGATAPAVTGDAATTT